jgi:DNA-binding MarR family transcriptional regulator
MPGRLQQELKQSRPFPPEEEALLSIGRTADALNRRLAEVLKPLDLSTAQYNVLRILRGAGKGGRTCSEIGDRMITHDPDVTRMLDRMEKRGWLTRVRDAQDRRVVRTTITPRGLKVLDQADPLVTDVREHVTRGLTRANLRAAIEVLNVVRGRAQ